MGERRVVQLTFDAEVEPEFLRLMRLVNIQKLPEDADPLEVLPYIPATAEERKLLTNEHNVTIQSQWRQCAEASKNLNRRDHFARVIPQIKNIIDTRMAEEEHYERREGERATLPQ